MIRRSPLDTFLAIACLCAFACTGSARAASAPEARLPRNPWPRTQSVRLKVDADKRSYSGLVRAELNVTAPVDSVLLHAEGQKLVRISLLQGGDTIAVERRSGPHGLLVLHAARPLTAGPAALEIEFTAMYGTRAVGLYKVSKDGRGYLFTQFEADDAREAFPCWDEPNFKIPYQLTLEVPAAHEAVSNTPIAKSETKDGWKTVEFARTPPLPSYLLALATGPLEFTPVPGTKFPTRVVTVQGQKQLTAFAVETTPKLVAALERWFGMPYPFAKLDLIAVPEFAYGAMENPGAITYRDDAILLDPATATVGQKRSIVNTNAHELAHMWFGDLVTMAWWDDLWLNESFADWMAAKISDEVYPDYRQGLNDLARQQAIKKSDGVPSTMAIRTDTGASGAGLQNVGLVYAKGNAVLSMFEDFLAPDVFRKGVREYLKEHAWGNATAADLWKALDAASGSNVSAAMSTFTDQPGIPMVRVVPIPGGVRLSQSRFSPYGVSQPDKKWHVPVSLRWSDGRTVRVQRVLLKDASMDVKLTGAGRIAWLMPNSGGHGYYAWGMPDSMLEALAAAAPEALNSHERVCFLGNLAQLLDAGDVHGDTYLRVVAHFGSDPEPQVLSSVLGLLAGARGAFVPDSAAAPFAQYVRQTLAPALERIGMERRAGEDELLGTIRGDLMTWLADRGGDERVRTFALEQTKRYLADSASVDPGIVEAVLELAAQKGDAVLFEELAHRAEVATVPAMKRRYLGTLGAFQDTTLESRALQYMLSDRVRSSESMLVMMGWRGKNEAAGERLFRWMMEHYSEIAARIPPPALRFLPMMGSGCSEERLQATKAFFGDPSRGIPGVEATLERVSDQVHGCISLRELEGAAVRRYLESLGAK
ncbi:MAG: ERAP1-like C-terminal domain-containing protein [Candidatus Eisenbacteria bacterium]|uniref:Aminopeptidase n=1 Tax=Eiseniibacteriota bacterium TaxID=2212470 RepID=A0A933SEF2_UNCEI|nr:ERAP1-like C-terminal domain-containing protein [Candidatus Eisenbacteria bacterium]